MTIQEDAGDAYTLLPFRFLPLDVDRYLLTNFAGEHLVLRRADLHGFIQHELPMHSGAYDILKSRHFLLDGDSTVPIDLLATKHRTKLARLAEFTSLFMFVTTLRCNHSCTYCQVSRRGEDAPGCDMPQEVADHAIEFMFRTPSRAIKVEFQGGESLLNFPIVQYIVEKVEERNKDEQREVAFVLTTNLSAMTDAALDFCYTHDIYISTSLDGPRGLHNANRPRVGRDSYAEVTQGICRVREALGPHKISALMTTTRASLAKPREIIDEYLRQGFSSVFLRPVNPYGQAVANNDSMPYTTEEWLQFYRQALEYILELGGNGVAFLEEYTALILRKMLTPYATGFVDLQSPAGIGIAGIVFNYDGGVYCSDEARMLAEMGDHKFRMGGLLNDSYEEIMLSDSFLNVLSSTVAESVPQCAECAVLPYCGSDPVRHYRSQGDVVGHKATSDFCKKHMGIVKHLVKLLEDDPKAARVLRTWV